jgi:hypothetical protein
LSEGQYKLKNRYPPDKEVTKEMQNWKIATAIGLVVVLSVLITGIAYASYANSTRPTTYNSYAAGAALQRQSPVPSLSKYTCLPNAT